MSSAKPPGAGAYILGEARYAVQDIRQKLFEEAWFGRVVTAAPVIEVSKPLDATASERSALEEAWGTARHQPKQEQSREVPEPSPELEDALGRDGLRRWLEKDEYDKDPDIER